jgi:hypothetical protein
MLAKPMIERIARMLVKAVDVFVSSVGVSVILY